MEKFVAKTSKNASAELIVSFLVDELQTPLNLDNSESLPQGIIQVP